MKILLTVLNAGLAGHTRTCAVIGKALQARGHRVIVLIGKDAQSVAFDAVGLTCERAEAKQRHEQAYYEAIVNATPVMLWLKDAKNRLLRLNPAAAKLEGVEAAEVEGKSCYEL